MTNEELKKIEDRANAATSGPWYWHQAKGFGADCFLRSKTDKTYGEWVYIASHITGFDNCEFIANSREDIPKLIAAIKEYKKRLGEEEPSPPPKAKTQDDYCSPGETTRLGNPNDQCD